MSERVAGWALVLGLGLSAACGPAASSDAGVDASSAVEAGVEAAVEAGGSAETGVVEDASTGADASDAGAPDATDAAEAGGPSRPANATCAMAQALTLPAMLSDVSFERVEPEADHCMARGFRWLYYTLTVAPGQSVDVSVTNFAEVYEVAACGACPANNVRTNLSALTVRNETMAPKTVVIEVQSSPFNGPFNLAAMATP